MNGIVFVELVKALAWPLVAAVALYLLRRPLVELVAQVARRASKVSVFEVSLELATLPALQSSWSVGDEDLRRLTSAQIFDSASQSLFHELLQPARAEYAIVDLEGGRAWLTSRLFIFALILGEAAGLRAFVFLETAAGTRRRFLGVATPSQVRRALGRRYPWLEEAFARALRDAYPAPYPAGSPGAAAPLPFSNDAPPFAEQHRVTGFVRAFIGELQRTSAPPPHEAGFYLEIGSPPAQWERAHWIDGERLEQDLAGVLAYAWVEDSPDRARGSVTEAVTRRDAAFVALVDSDRRFLALVDRMALLSQQALQRRGGTGEAV